MKQEKTIYPVVVKFWNNRIGWTDLKVMKKEATSLEQAQDTVARYCAYHCKRAMLLSDDSITVVKRPAVFNIAFLFNSREHEKDAERLFDTLLTLEPARFPVVRAEASALQGDLDYYTLSFHGDASLKSKIQQMFFVAQKEEHVIDYTVNCYEIPMNQWMSICTGVMKSLVEYLR